MMSRPLFARMRVLDRITLHRLHVEEGRSIREIAAASGRTAWAVWSLVTEYGLGRRPHESKRRTPEERFSRKYEAAASRCWRWTAGHTPLGYGLFRLGGRMVYAHRWAYEKFRGPIPNGLELDHLCRLPACVNPAHLEAVTHAVNMGRAMDAKKPVQITGDPQPFPIPIS